MLKEIEAVLTRGNSKDVADAAMALAYLQERSDRRWVDMVKTSITQASKH